MFKVKHSKGAQTISEINVTPLVDVSLVLVIIFMVTVPMLFQPMAEIQMPKAVTGSEQNKQLIYITFTQDRKILLDSDEVNFRQLYAQMKFKLEKSVERLIIIRADERLPYETVTQLMAMAKKAGAKKIVFATEYKKRE
jgi:biopolymer transport protein ExbD